MQCSLLAPNACQIPKLSKCIDFHRGATARSSMTELHTPGLPVALASTGGDGEESMWGSDWESDWLWESDWESDCETMPAVATEQIKSDYDSENEVLRVKSMKSLTSDDSRGRRIPPTKARRRVNRSTDEDLVGLDDDDEEQDEDDTDSESEGGAPGFACHFCKLRNGKRKVQCSRCPIKVCGLCLQNRNGEQLEVEIQEGVKWVCPKCRAGCGPGCNNCCTCAPCRKSQGLAPAGQVIRVARQVGFDNVHDYLIHRQTGESRDKIAKRKKGRGWTKAGGAIMSSSSTGLIVPKLKPAQRWTATDCSVPATIGGVERWNQKEGVSWTTPTVIGDIMKSTNNNVNPGDGKSGAAIVPFGYLRQPENGMKAFKSINDERKEPVNERRKVLDHVLGREAQKSERMKLSLQQVIDRLLHSEDVSEAHRGGIGLKRRNRKHRKLGRIMEPSMFRNRKSKTGTDTKPSETTPEVLPTVRNGNAQSDKCLKQQSNPPPRVQSVPHGQHDQPSLETPIQLKRPITSLQALRKIGILPKRTHAYFASEESSQQQGPAIAPSPLRDHSKQSFKESSKVEATPPPVRPSTSPESGSQAISLRHLERRKKIEFRSCLKSHNAIPVLPTSGHLVKESILWRGGLRPIQSGPQSGVGQFSEKRSVAGFELPRQNGTQSGFESFSQKEKSTGFESFDGEGKAALSALKT